MRIDDFLVKKGFFESRTKSKRAVLCGTVYVDGKAITKPSFDLEGENHEITVTAEEKFVSLGGFKLEKALADFKFDVKGMIVADLGASTGGFTDCLIKNGAKSVYAVDLNPDLLHEKLKNDERVVSVIKNVKDVVPSDFNELDLITADLSFISVKSLLGIIYGLLSPDKHAIILIKPQFEVGEKRRFKNGIIKDEALRKNVCKNVYEQALSVGFSVIDFTVAPIVKGKNVEYLMLLEKSGGKSSEFDKLYKT